MKRGHYYKKNKKCHGFLAYFWVLKFKLTILEFFKYKICIIFFFFCQSTLKSVQKNFWMKLRGQPLHVTFTSQIFFAFTIFYTSIFVHIYNCIYSAFAARRFFTSDLLIFLFDSPLTDRRKIKRSFHYTH